MSDSGSIRVIAFQEGDLWVAQCIEYDVGAQASNLEDLHDRLMIALRIEMEESAERNGKPFAGIPPAPPHFLKMWERQSGRFHPNHPTELHDGGTVKVELALAA